MPAHPTPVEVTLEVTSVLEELGVRYAIGGSIASTLHGIFRASVDVDIVAELHDDHVSRLIEKLAHVFYLDEIAMRRAIESRRSFNLIHLATMFKVDLFIPRGRPFDESELARRSAYVIATDPPRSAFVAITGRHHPREALLVP